MLTKEKQLCAAVAAVYFPSEQLTNEGESRSWSVLQTEMGSKVMIIITIYNSNKQTVPVN